MRLMIDTLIALMLAAILGGLVWHHRAQARDVSQMQTVHRALARLSEAIVYHGALIAKDDGQAGFPKTIAPAWFGEQLPVNVIVPGRQPWIDVAPTGDHGDHPPDPVITRGDQAGFWYNPNRGIIRARVIAQFSQRETLELYNTLNGTALKLLPTSEDLQRMPEPLKFDPVVTAQDETSSSPDPEAPATDNTARPTLKARTMQQPSPRARPSLRSSE